MTSSEGDLMMATLSMIFVMTSELSFTSFFEAMEHSLFKIFWLVIVSEKKILKRRLEREASGVVSVNGCIVT